MKIEVGQVWTYTDRNGRKMKRLILAIGKDYWTSKILICEYNRMFDGLVESLDYEHEPLGGNWILDEAEMVRNIIKSYE